MKNKLILDYIMSLTHLYGLVHRDKVVEVYNMQNDDKISEANMSVILKEGSEELVENFIEIHGEYFVAESIIEFKDFEEQLIQRSGKPFYIPDKEELLKYKDDFYYEITKEYKILLNYATKKFFNGDEDEAEMLCEEIQGICQFGFSVKLIIDAFTQRDISFKCEEQVNEVMQLVMNLANNTRIWENNGHTPNEIFELMEKPNLRPLSKDEVSDFMNLGQAVREKKVGRNEPCPCGSGKKYKKCCGSN